MRKADTVTGYLIDKDGSYSLPYHFENNAENIATFILQNALLGICRVVDSLGCVVCTSLFGFVDDVPDEDYFRNVLFPVYLEYEQKKKVLDPIEFVTGKDGEFYQKSLCE